jgi:hypothetical protein
MLLHRNLVSLAVILIVAFGVALLWHKDEKKNAQPIILRSDFHGQDENENDSQGDEDRKNRLSHAKKAAHDRISSARLVTDIKKVRGLKSKPSFSVSFCRQVYISSYIWKILRQSFLIFII